jgi:hypothetical protein
LREVREFFIAGVGAVAGFATVTFGHPDGLDGLAVGKLKEVANGAIRGSELLFDGGQADGVAELGKLLTERDGQRGKLVEVGPPLAEEAV